MLKQVLPLILLVIISILFLTNCEENEENSFEQKTLPSPLNSHSEEIEPGAYCFTNNKNNTNIKTAQLLIASDYTVTGIIENLNNLPTKNNQNVEYREFLAGILNESDLEVTINREKADKNQSRKERWRLTLNSLIINQETYQKINCEKLINNNFN